MHKKSTNPDERGDAQNAWKHDIIQMQRLRVRLWTRMSLRQMIMHEMQEELKNELRKGKRPSKAADKDKEDKEKSGRNFLRRKGMLFTL